jgi:DNA-binding NarL/FixJ family response regulator
VDEDRAVSAAVRSVVIVDDHAHFRRSVRSLLEALGFAVVGEAADGDEALRQVALTAAEVVLLDVQLPGRDGFAVAAELDRLPVPPAVVMISSRDAAVYAADLATARVRGFVAKGELSGASLARLLG